MKFRHEESVDVIDDTGVRSKRDRVGFIFKNLSGLVIIVMIVLHVLAFLD
jgi:hypothetical protein